MSCYERDWEKMIYICVGYNSQKWEKILVCFESRANGMVKVEWTNDLNLDLKT